MPWIPPISSPKKNKFPHRPHRKGQAIRFHSGPAQQFLQLLVIQTIPAQGIEGCNGCRNGEFASKDGGTKLSKMLVLIWLKHPEMKIQSPKKRSVLSPNKGYKGTPELMVHSHESWGIQHETSVYRVVFNVKAVKGTGSIESINQSFGVEISPISATSGMM